MRFGISETSWMLPKILRIRLDAVERVSPAWGAMVAIRCVRLFCRPRKLGTSSCRQTHQTQKAASLPPGNRSFSVLETPSDQCVERAARRRVLFRCGGIELPYRNADGGGQPA